MTCLHEVADQVPIALSTDGGLTFNMIANISARPCPLRRRRVTAAASSGPAAGTRSSTAPCTCRHRGPTTPTDAAKRVCPGRCPVRDQAGARGGDDHPCGHRRRAGGVGGRGRGLRRGSVAAQDRWRAVNAPHLVALVRVGAKFVNGKLVEREEDQQAVTPPVQTAAIRKLRACWVTHGPVRWWVTPRRWTRRVPISRTNSTEIRRGNTVSTVNKSHASIVLACARHNARQLGPTRRGGGVQTGPAQDVPHRRWRDSVAKTDQLPVDATMSPARVLPGQPNQQGPGRRRTRWSTACGRGCSETSNAERPVHDASPAASPD